MTTQTYGLQQVVLRGKFIGIQAYLKKQKAHKMNKLPLHQEQLEKELKQPKVRRKNNHEDQSRNK